MWEALAREWNKLELLGRRISHRGKQTCVDADGQGGNRACLGGDAPQNATRISNPDAMF
jgi:hypothetical protein